MLAEIVFTTRLLGLVGGELDVALNATPEVQRVVIQTDGRTIATIAGPPWKTKIDLGDELRPQELIAIAYDERGNEAGRDAQILNLARPPAEVGVVLDRGADGAVSARLQFAHVDGLKPVSAAMRFDDRVISRKSSTAPVALGNIAPGGIHVIEAEARFPDGAHALSEVVFGGVFGAATSSELTSIPVIERERLSREDCIRVGSETVKPRAIEKGTAVVSFIVNGYPTGMYARGAHRDLLYAVHNATFRLVVAKREEDASGADHFPSALFAGGAGTRQVLLASRGRPEQPRYAEAIAASALRALRDGNRRAIVYVLGAHTTGDRSDFQPAVVRRYLQRIGVPLHVWSLTGPRPDLMETWGPVEDASTPGTLVRATTRLREELEQQRIAWIPGRALDALAATATDDCRWMPMAITPSARGEAAR